MNKSAITCSHTTHVDSWSPDLATCVGGGVLGHKVSLCVALSP